MNFNLKIRSSLFISLQAIMILMSGFYSGTNAQTILRGIVRDSSSGERLPGAVIQVIHKNDPSIQSGINSDENGNYSLKIISSGNHILKCSLVGYKTFEKNIYIQDDSLSINLSLISSLSQLKGVTIEDKQIVSQQKGDTSQFNASSFKVNKDATTEDLIKKMPGIIVDNGKITAQGEEVKKVLIDGREFFGDDASIAIKNLPAEVVDKIQFFDRLSDQAQFSGFDDGNSRKTMNIMTRGGLRDATFGRFSGGFGTYGRYKSSAIFNRFKEARRVTILSQSNNINQQNFSGEDMMGLAAGVSHGGNMDRMNRIQGLSPGANDPSNFMVGQQNGINTTHSLGINYTDSIGSKIKLTGSYFFNNTANNTEKNLTREFFSTDTITRAYFEESDSWSNNLNHRITLRVEFSFDTLNSLIYTPRYSWQGNQSGNGLEGNTMSNAINLTSSSTRNSSENFASSMGHNLLLRHKFRKFGRTISLSLNADFLDRISDSRLNSNNFSLFDSDSLNILQKGKNDSQSRTYTGNLTYTEPLGKRMQLFVSVNPSTGKTLSDKNTDRLNSGNGDFFQVDSLLSNSFERNLNTLKGGMGIRFQSKKITAMANMNAQQVELSGNQTFPSILSVERSFFDLLPMAMFNCRFNKSSNLRIFYRTYTNAPTIAQLQNVADNSNPVQLSAGDPNLNQEYNHSLVLRYGFANTKSGKSLFLNLNGTFINDYIGNYLIIAGRDTLLNDGTRLLSGAQLTKPVNLNGYANTKSLITYSIPLNIIKCNLNFQAGLNYSNIPGKTNSNFNRTNNYGYSGGIVLASNISEKIDFTMAYSGGWNLVQNLLQPERNNNYKIHNASFRGNWVPRKHWVFNSSVNYSLYNGLNNFNQQIILWNAEIGYRFLKKEQAEFRFSAYDILGQNTSISRHILENYVEDSRTRILTQYFLLSFSYTLRNFKTGNH